MKVIYDMTTPHCAESKPYQAVRARIKYANRADDTNRIRYVCVHHVIDGKSEIPAGADKSERKKP